MKRIIRKKIAGKHGQSLVELSIILLILALLVAGVVEYGFLLNNYLHVVDGAREAARLTSNAIPFYQDPVTKEYDYEKIDPTFYVQTAYEATYVMSPLALNPKKGDDVIVTVYSMSSGYSLVQFPTTGPWSLCSNKSKLMEFIDDNDLYTPPSLGMPGWDVCVPQVTKITSGIVWSHMDSSAPSTGALVVEIFYNYPQVLKLPIFTNSLYSIVPDPIPVYAYTVMPIGSAEPTPTPIP